MWKNIKNAWRWIWIGNRYVLKLVGLLFLIAIIFTMISYNDKAEAAGDTIEDKKEAEVVFAVCVFADGSLIDHKGANSMSDCLKTKREVEKAWRNKADETDSVEINGITYKIDGESLAFMCDLVDANVHHYEDGTWEIVKILGKHKKDE